MTDYTPSHIIQKSIDPLKKNFILLLFYSKYRYLILSATVDGPVKSRETDDKVKSFTFKARKS